MNRTKNSRLDIIVVLAAAFTVCGAFAQIGGGSIVGTVTDPSGAAIPGVNVTALNVGTNVSYSTSTNDAGYYEFPLLPAGRYRIEAGAKGFQGARRGEFTLNSGTRPRLDLTLALGVVVQSLEVQAVAPLVNATTNDLGMVVDRSKVDSLPLNGRNFQSLVGLQAGVINTPSSSFGNRGGIEFHGSSALGNNLLLDGVDMTLAELNSSASDAGAGGGGLLINTISVDAIEEFKATGSAFSAEYGRASGGVLNITSRSGTNQFRGSLFEYFRNDKLDANSFFNNRSALKKPPLRWNQYGGNFAGPVVRDRLFFFANYEGAQVRRASSITGNTYTPALLQQLKPPIRALFSAVLPEPTESTSNPLIGFHRRNDRRANQENTLLGRGDMDLGDRRLSLRFSYNHQDYSEPNFMPSMPTVYPLRFHNAVIQDSWSLAPTLFNELRVGFNRSDLFRHERGRERLPAQISVTGTGPNVSLNSWIRIIPTTYTLADNFTIIRGRHSIKSGFEIREVRSARDQDGLPTHTYNNLNDLIADRANRIGLPFGGSKGLNTRNYGFYAQDDWRVSQRVQVNVGLRYEYYPPFRGGFNIASSDPYGPFIASAREPMFAADRNNWGPRLGIVWDPMGQQKWVLRTGGGISYGPPQPLFAYDLPFVHPALPFVTNYAPADVPVEFRAFPLDMKFVNSIKANPSLLPSSLILARQVVDYNRRDTYAGQWNLSVQRAVTSFLAVQVAYVGSRTINLNSPRTLNLVNPATGRRPRPEFGDVKVMENIARISYHALQVSANQRLRKGMSFDVYYTWAKSLAYGAVDSSMNFTENNMQDHENLAGSYGRKQGDIRHRFVGLYSMAIPTGRFAVAGFRKAVFDGWTFQGIMTARSGLPLNVLSGVDFVGNGRAAGQRPDLLLGIAPYLPNDADELSWLNPAAFDNRTPAAERRFGNLGFNALSGPADFSYNAALHKIFSINEAQRVVFRFEMFNALNHKNLNNPNATVTNPNFGKILGASGGRNIQFALKYHF